MMCMVTDGCVCYSYLCRFPFLLSSGDCLHWSYSYWKWHKSPSCRPSSHTAGSNTPDKLLEICVCSVYHQHELKWNREIPQDVQTHSGSHFQSLRWCPNADSDLRWDVFSHRAHTIMDVTGHGMISYLHWPQKLHSDGGGPSHPEGQLSTGI